MFKKKIPKKPDLGIKTIKECKLRIVNKIQGLQSILALTCTVTIVTRIINYYFLGEKIQRNLLKCQHSQRNCEEN